MSFKYFLLIILLIACNSTSDDMEGIKINEEGVIDSLPFLWSKSLHDGEFTNKISTIRKNIIHDGNPIIGMTESEYSRSLRKIDADTGDEVWRWSDTYIPEEEVTEFHSYYQFGNNIIWVNGSRHYSLNLETGSTTWKNRIDFSALAWITGYNDKYFFLAPAQDTLEGYINYMIYQGNATTGQVEPFLKYDDLSTSGLEDDKRVSSVFNIKYVNWENKNLLLADGRDPFINNETQRHLSLYDLDTQSWIYQKEPIGLIEGNNSGNIEIETNRIFVAAGKNIECYDLLSGQQIWKKEFPHNFNFSGIILTGNKVIGNCENKVLYCLDTKTGESLWTGEGSGTSSDLVGREINGILYFSGGGPNRLFGVNVDSGKTVWKIKAEEYEESNALWKWDLYVIPSSNTKTGKVVACSHKNIYCFNSYN